MLNRVQSQELTTLRSSHAYFIPATMGLSSSKTSSPPNDGPNRDTTCRENGKPKEGGALKRPNDLNPTDIPLTCKKKKIVSKPAITYGETLCRADGKTKKVGALQCPNDLNPAGLPPKCKTKVFLSHTGQDGVKDALAKPIRSILEKLGRIDKVHVQIFVDDGGMEIGRPYGCNIVQGGPFVWHCRGNTLSAVYRTGLLRHGGKHLC